MKKKLIPIISIVVATVSLWGCGSASLDLKKNNMIVEVGSSLSGDVNEYVNITDEKMKDDITIDRSGVDTSKVGSGEIIVKYRDKAYSISVKVEDTKGPTISQKVYTIDHHTEYNVEDLVDVSDPSGYTVAFENGEKTCYFPGDGTESLKIVAEDSYGNKTIKEIEVEVYKSYLDKNSEAYDAASRILHSIVNNY